MDFDLKLNQSVMAQLEAQTKATIDEVLVTVAQTHEGRPVSEVEAELKRLGSERGIEFNDNVRVIAQEISDSRPGGGHEQ